MRRDALFQHTSVSFNGPKFSDNAHHLNLPAEFSVDEAKRLVIVRFRKKLTVEDIGRYVTMLRAEASFRPIFSEIADLTLVEEVSLQANDFMRLADQVDPFSVDAKRAFVAKTAVQTHAARMHKILRTQRNIEIFSTIQEAERWVAK